MKVNVKGFGLVDQKILLELQSQGYRFQRLWEGDDRWEESLWDFSTPLEWTLYRCEDTKCGDALRSALNQGITLQQVQEFCKKNGYTLKKKEPVVQTWKFHKYNLNETPEDILKAEPGDIVKLDTFYFKVEGTTKIYLTVVDLSGEFISPELLGHGRDGYAYTHVRTPLGDQSGDLSAAIFGKENLLKAIKSGEYKIR